MDKTERSQVIARFRAGEIRVIFNVRVLSTGFDYTGIDCIVLGVSTASIALYSDFELLKTRRLLSNPAVSY